MMTLKLKLIAGFVVMLGLLAYVASLPEKYRQEGRAEEQEKARQAIAKTVKQEAKIVVKTEIEYRDKIKKIYIKGDEIEKTVYKYISPAVSDSILVTDGFVRVQNAAWTSTPAGTPSVTDNEPAGIPLATVAETETHNATSCRAWREQALGLRAFYADLKKSRDSD